MLSSAFHTKLNSYLNSDPLAAALFVVLVNNLVNNQSPLLAKADKLLASNSLDLSQMGPEDKALLSSFIQHPPSSPHWQPYYKRIGPWLLGYNPLRLSRPTRLSEEITYSIAKPFDINSFNFGRIPEELFFNHQVDGLNVSYLYNKYPFGRYHCSVVPELNANHPQLITKSFNELAFKLARHSDIDIDDPIIAYNSLGAYASVNHFHFQLMENADVLPLIQHIRSPEPISYPLHYRYVHTPNESWQIISKLLKQNIAHTLLYTRDGCIVIARQMQGSVRLPDWLNGIGWTEVSGLFLSNRADVVQSTQEQTLNSLLKKINIDS